MVCTRSRRTVHPQGVNGPSGPVGYLLIESCVQVRRSRRRAVECTGQKYTNTNTVCTVQCIYMYVYMYTCMYTRTMWYVRFQKL